MKLDELQQKDRLEIKAEKGHEKQHKLIGRIVPQNGHTLFKVNDETSEVSLAEYEKQDINFQDAVNGNVTTSRKVIIEDGYSYYSALNKRNALKKHRKQ